MVYCSDYNTLQNCGPHRNFRAFLGFQLDGRKHSSSSHDLLLSFHTLFAWSITSHILACWLLCHAYEFVLAFWRFDFVCMSCFFSINIGETHTLSCKHFRTSVVIVIRRHISIVILVTLSLRVSLTEHMFYSWLEVSCHRVTLSVWSQCRVCKSTPFTHRQFS